MAGAIFIPTLNFHHICIFLNIHSQKKRALILAYIFSFVSVLFDFTPFFVKGVSPKLWFAYWPDAGIAYGPFLAIWAWLSWYYIHIINKSLHNTIGEKRNQLRYLLLATILGWIGGATNFPLWFNIPIPPLGNILISAYIALIAYAIARYRLMVIKNFINTI